MAQRQRSNLVTPALEVGIVDCDGIGPLRDGRCERRVNFALGAGVNDDDLQPEATAAVCAPWLASWDMVGLFGFTSTTILVALGIASCNNSSRFAVTSLPRKVAPVTLPPGRLRLATSPPATGSAPVVKTIGITRVVAIV